MSQAAELIQRARQAAKVKEAGATKIRMSRELYRRAAACARAAGEPLGRWMRLCTLEANYGRAKGVAIPENLTVATRADVVATVQGTHADPDETRRRIAAVTIRCEACGSVPDATAPREGVDYFLEGKDYPSAIGRYTVKRPRRRAIPGGDLNA
jgi:hypothetical protein